MKGAYTTGAALTIGAVAKSGTVAVVLTVTDSRGYTASVTKNITVISYASPKVSSVTLRRINDIETEMQLVFSGSFSPITVSSTAKNSQRYDTAIETLEKLKADRTLREQQDKAMGLYIRTLKKSPQVLQEWGDTIWTVLVEKAVVHKNKSITFHFYNGNKKTVRA